MRRLAVLLAASMAALPLLARSALAESGAAPPLAQIRVTGHGMAEAAPDLASVSIGVSNRAPTAAAALDATSAAASRIIEAAKGASIAPRDIQTGAVSLQPAFKSTANPGGGSEQRPDGYTASNAVTVRVRDLGRFGEVLRSVVDSGANRIGGIEWGVADPASLSRKALEAAIRDARSQAETAAAAAGVKLGRIQEIRSGEHGDGPLSFNRSRAFAAAAPAPPVPVEGGSLTVSADVSVVWTIE